MTQVHLSMKQKQTRRHGKWTCSGQGGGEMGDGNLGLAYANYYI